MLAVEEFRSARRTPVEQPENDSGRSAVLIVCSPRPRVGKTLVARLLTEFFLTDRRPVIAFDVNPNDPVLSDYLPAYTEQASVAETPGQMALFDRLVINDGLPKVVDVAADQFKPFFDTMTAIRFPDAAAAAAIDTVILFVAENHARSVEAYRKIQEELPRATLVPVHNELVESYGAPVVRHPSNGTPPVTIPHLPPYLLGVVKKPSFSFSKFLNQPSQFPTLLHKWVSQPYIGFRDIELRLSLADFAPLFR